MRTRLSLVLLPAALVAAAASAQTPLNDATVVARAGTQSITRAQLDAHLMKYYARNALEQLINRSVVRQEAARFKVEVADSAINTRLAEMKRQGGPEFLTAVETQGLTDDLLKERVKADLLVQGLLEKKWPVRDSDLVRLSVRYARLQTERVARDLIQEANLSKGRNFELLVLQRSIDKEEGGLVQPNPFLRIDNPPMFKLAEEAIRSQGLAVGQITRRPVQSKQFWLVLKLENYLGPDTLKGAERERTIQRIQGARLPALLPSSRKRYKVEQPVAAAQLVSDPKLAPDTVVAKVTPVSGEGGENITRKELSAFLVETFGRTGVDQLVERAVTTQLAAKAGASVSDAEVDARFSAVKRGTGEKAFTDALALEGITEDAWRERVRYTYLAEKTVNTRAPLAQNDLVRMTARYIRVASKAEADAVLKAAQGAGQQFEALARQRSLDRNGDHFIRPRLFFPAEQPDVFRALSGVTPGQVAPRPLELAGSYYVLRLEGRFGPELLSAKEREDALRRINAVRMGPLLDTWRKEIKVEYPVPMKALVASARA